MLKIRLQRVGKRNQAAFRIVLTEKHKAAKKSPNEVLGFYNPSTKEFGIKDDERLRYWIDQNVEISETVHNLFVEKDILKGDKVQAWRPKVKKQSADEEKPESGDGASEEKKEEGQEEDQSEEKPKDDKPAESEKEDKEEVGEEKSEAEPKKDDAEKEEKAEDSAGEKQG